MIPKALLIGWLTFIVVLLTGSFAILQCELDGLDPQIQTYGDALWWSINVSSAVGDCELYPLTPIGRIISVVLMIFGYALFSLNVSAIMVLMHRHLDYKKH